ncbi:hypothetical protein D7Y32_12795 [Stenotrophomonas maltophilia]|jgi:hypothetical protein|nr:hypothetical protein DP16_1996 [Stenotrophomonas maltophilia]MBA0260814.1 hypothetical protein [Stenotrophomonas maltophilia]OMP40378.1 hypothetical protein BMR86_07445 [Stenotrophomonas sp. KAs 5-3]OOD14794.1 hypothetical protein BWP19_10710 [Stenotrophomonas maltophilia]SNW09382.1 Uncharacterised protein [Stenotrophomonas maltophilia]
MATKSLIVSTMVDRAKKAHNCQANSKHRIERGDIRLGVRKDRGWDRYCVACAQSMIERGLLRLGELSKLEPEESED